MMVGYTTCLAAALARELLEEKADLGRGITSGINAMRTLHLKGCGPTDPTNLKIAFPFDEVAEAVANPKGNPASSEIPEPQAGPAGAAGESWTILGGRFGRDLRPIAHEIIKRGVEAVLTDVPPGGRADPRGYPSQDELRAQRRHGRPPTCRAGLRREPRIGPGFAPLENTYGPPYPSGCQEVSIDDRKQYER